MRENVFAYLRENKQLQCYAFYFKKYVCRDPDAKKR